MYRFYYTINNFVPVGSTNVSYITNVFLNYNQSDPYATVAQNLAKLMILKYSNTACAYYDDYEEPAALTDPTSPLWQIKGLFEKRLTYIFEATKERYKCILDAYAAQKDKLFDKIKSTSQFNDTPQTPLSGGLVGEDYATTFTKNEVDFEVIDRLTKVSQLYQNVLNDWLNEFSGQFMED